MDIFGGRRGFLKFVCADKASGGLVEHNQVCAR